MAGFEYGGGGEDLSSSSSGTRPFDSDGYMGFDPRLPSQRFDSSQRFDESFRAPDNFNPGFGDDTKEMDDEYKSSNGFSYHQSDTPPAYGHGYGDESAVESPEPPAGYMASFEPDLHSDYEQSGEYMGANGENGNGFGANGDDDNLFSSIPQASDGPILPPPEDMKEEGSALREWKRQNAIRLEEKERKEREKLSQIIEEADDYKESVFAKRRTAIENGKKNNRDKEKTYLANQDTFHKEAPKHYWKAVAELIPNELPTIDKGGKKDKKDKKTGITAIKGPKPGKSTDMSRMRNVLVKLKHNPPAHMKYTPPPPPPVAEKDKENTKDKDGKDKSAAPPAPKDGATATPSSAAAPESAPPAAAAVTA